MASLERWRLGRFDRLPEAGPWVSPVTAAVLVLLPYTAPAWPVALFTGVALVLLACLAPRGPLIALPLTLGLVYQPMPTGLGSARVSPAELLIVASATGAALRGTWSVARLASRSRSAKAAVLTRIGQLRFSALALGLLVVGATSLGTVADPTHFRESLREFRWVIVEPVVAYLLYCWYLRDPSDRWRAAGGWVVAGSLVGLYSIGAGLAGSGIQVEGVLRISGLHPHPNALALYLERPLVLAATIALLGDRRRWLWAIPTALLTSALVLTFSRGALASVVLTLGLVSLVTQRYRQALALAAAGACLALVLTLVAPERILTSFYGGSGSLRLHIWSSAVAMVRDSPLLGVGLDQFLYQYAPRYVAPEAWPERFTSHPHNLVLDAWLRLGLAGVVLLICGTVLVLRCLYHAARSRNALALAASFVIVEGGVHGLVDNGYFLPDLALAFWLLAAILEPESRSPAHQAEAGREG
jgi:O-antigen ligase